MVNTLSKWKIIIILFTIVSSVAYSLTIKDEFCPVIDDSRIVDTIAAVNKFNDLKIYYFVDYQKSYQILVEKSQLDEAYIALSIIGITLRSKHDASCKFVR